MLKFRYLAAVLLTFALFVNIAVVKSQEIGLPFITNYNPVDYNGQGQVWSIVQMQNGVMLFGGNDGIYEYDGAKWDKIIISENNNARSMDISSDGTVYVGSTGELGYLKYSKIGKLEFVSLKEKIDTTYQNFNDIWNTYVVGDNVVFNASEILFVYDIKSEDIKIIKPENRLFMMHKVYNELYVVDIRFGLKKLAGDSLMLVKGGEKFALSISWFMLPYADNKILIGNETDGVRVYNPNETNVDSIVTKRYFNSEELAKTEQFIVDNQLYGGIQLNNGNYALATINKGIIIIDKSGKIVQNINKSNGLNSETVHCFYQDNQGGLWAGLTYGISRLEVSSPFSFWNEKTNLLGSIYNVIRFENTIYASSNLGLYYLENNIFQPVTELAGINAVQVFVLEKFNFPESNETKFLITATHGIWEISDFHANRISTYVSFYLYQSRKNQNQIYVIQDYDIFILTYENGIWSESEALYSFESFPSSVIEDNDFNLWVLMDGKPIFIDISKNQINYFENDSLVKNLEFNSIDFVNDEIIFSTTTGFFTFQNNTFVKKDFQKLINSNSISGFEKITENLFAYFLEINEQDKLFILNQNSNNEVFDTLSFNRISEYDLIYPDLDSVLWIISPQKLFKYDLKLKPDYSSKIKPLIRQVFINLDSLVYCQTAENQMENYIFDFEFNNLKINYSLPFFDSEKDNLFSVSLVKKGKKEKWSEWTNLTEKEFTNLFEGKYILKVKAKNIYGIESEVAEFYFEILPPWYITTFAYIVYIILFILMLFASAKLYSRKLLKEKQKLEQIVLERTSEIREKNAELEQQKEEIQTIADNLIETNAQLAEKNEEINQQKEEIQTIADNLQELNETLLQKNEEINQQNEEIKTIADTLSTANKEISNQNLKILASIKYAQRIQEALLPVKANIDKFLPNNFIFYKPKDIVSGDFYWFKNIYFEGDRLNLIVVGDCTGHGVPGALMSMLGISFLNEIVKHEDVKTPSQVLDRLRDYVKKTLKQTGKEKEAKDGMDMAFCVISSKSLKLSFAGANLPLYIVSKNKELTIIKGDRMPIGIHINEKENFTNNEFQLSQNDCIYMATDGYIDQPCGNAGRKFLSNGFQQLLLSISEKNIDEQKIIMQNTFENWLQGDKTKEYKQIDDVTVLAIKI